MCLKLRTMRTILVAMVGAASQLEKLQYERPEAPPTIEKPAACDIGVIVNMEVTSQQSA